MDNKLRLPWRSRSWHGPTIENVDGESVASASQHMDYIIAACNAHGELAGTVRTLLARVNQTDLTIEANADAAAAAIRVIGKIVHVEALRDAVPQWEVAITRAADSEALTAIHALLNDRVWTVRTVQAIASIVHATGRPVDKAWTPHE